MTTIYDIAREAGVSAMTVSRVINNSGRISAETRMRVRRVMEELHYVPNSNARSLVIQKTHILSLLITDITNPFYTTLARGAEDTAKTYGYRLLLGNSDEDYGKEKDYVDMILSTRVDGVLFAPAGDGSGDHLRLLERQGIPYVLLDREVPGIAADRIAGESREGAMLLVRHLLELGHRRIAFVGGSRDVSTVRDREAGYREALEQAGIPADSSLILHLHYRDGLQPHALDGLLRQPEPPTAVLAANNFLAVGIIRSLRSLGLRVPEDLSVVCFDDLGHASSLHPFLTVAAQPAYRFGSLGMERLIARIEGNAGTEPHTKVLPVELIIRESSGPPSQADCSGPPSAGRAPGSSHP
ncbi:MULTISPECIES: substrate-binding domain-containing protein [unclassified Paenibacillus]|uniref:LacI family DNA-binding transcriptional regulator n=1 Tax=unclassified Paenibacillus TaxID=185978 RepID=UPI0009551CFB|nr:MULTISPECIES: substrate-binding domain-containing protein [unclassified Paenibacillus]ASS69264.1 LacI family transcriptional regulator [Paenibacillus sp. RUD330]SIP94421.1 LacI family transcriptional regulator [Paenibacillus sp. RU4X]SIQ12858.1 LacI family transcriptional regulator [Paenibacillus sp. RU4T]